jgi:hypothetical protein
METVTKEELEKIASDFIVSESLSCLEIEASMNVNDFIIRNKDSEIMKIGFITFINLIIVAVSVYFVDGIAMVFIVFVFSLSLLFLLYLFIIVLRYKITVKNNQIISVTMLKKKKSFSFYHITKVKFTISIEIEKDYIEKSIKGKIQNVIIEPFHKDESLFFITPDKPGCNILISRFKDMDIPFEYELK